MVLDFSPPIIHTQAGTPQISILDPGSLPHHSLLSSLLILLNARSLRRTLFVLWGASLTNLFKMNPNHVEIIIFDCLK